MWFSWFPVTTLRTLQSISHSDGYLPDVWSVLRESQYWEVDGKFYYYCHRYRVLASVVVLVNRTRMCVFNKDYYRRNVNGAGIAQSVWRLVTVWTTQGSNPGGGEIFRTLPDRSWDPSSLIIGTGHFPGVKWPGRGVYHPPHLAPRLKNGWSATSTPPLGFRGLF